MEFLEVIGMSIIHSRYSDAVFLTTVLFEIDIPPKKKKILFL